MSQESAIAVESDINLGRLIHDVCHELGLDVRVFHDALDALMAAAKSKPDVMIFDPQTSVLGSLDFAEVVLRDPQFRPVALIGIVDETDVVRLRRYSSRGIAIAAKNAADQGKTLRQELSRLLRRHVTQPRHPLRRGVPSKGAA